MSHQTNARNPGYISLPANLTERDISTLRTLVEAHGTDVDRETFTPLLVSLAAPFVTSTEPKDIDPTAPRLYRTNDLLEAWGQQAESLHQNFLQGKPQGPMTGFPGLDEAIGGALAPGLHVVQGDTKLGKSALCLQIAAQCGFPALYVTCEQSALEHFQRIISRTSGIYMGRFATGEISPDQAIIHAQRALITCPQLAILDATRDFIPVFPNSSMEIGRSLYEVALSVKGNAEHMLVVLDSLHTWAHGMPDAREEYYALNEGIRALLGCASALNCPVIYMAERNRESNKTNVDKRQGYGGAGTRRIEYTAETVIDLDRIGEIDERTKQIRLTIQANRHGASGITKNFTFNGALMEFKEDGR